MTALLLALVSAAGPNIAGTVMVLPLSPSSGDMETAWVGESVADALPRELARLGVAVVDRADRLRAHDLLAIPAVSLTRATSIRMAEALGVSRLVEGTFEVNGKDLTLSLRLLDVARGTLSAPLIATGSVESLPSLVRSLAWDVALSGPTPPRVTREAFLASDLRPAPPLEAQKTYGQALSGRDPAVRRRLLKKALSVWPSFDEARVALGSLELDARQSDAALQVLARVPSTSPLSRAARFQLGRANLDLGHYDEAANIYAALSVESPTAGVLNNYGLALLRRSGPPSAERASDALRKAVDLGPGLSEPPFNLGWALLTEGENDAAAFWMRGRLREDARDVHARIVLVWSLRRAGHNDEADAEWKQLLAVAPSYEPFATPDLARRFERLMASESPPLLDQDRWGDAQAAAAHLGRARKLQEGGDSDGAIGELTQAVYLDPYDAVVHHELARLHRARGEAETTVSELRMSLWCKDDPGVRVELAEVLRDQGHGSEAKAEAEKVLKADPSNAAARRIVEGH